MSNTNIGINQKKNDCTRDRPSSFISDICRALVRAAKMKFTITIEFHVPTREQAPIVCK